MIYTVLIVDDEPDMEALVLQKFRRRIGAGAIRFVTAQDGIEALEVLAGDAVDLVVSDINMPRMDGLALLQKLQESDLEIATIIVSAYGDMTNIRTAMNRGAFDFLMKPIDLQDLEKTIDRTLEQIERMRQITRDRSDAERARSALARYFSPKLADQLATDPRFMQLGGERRVGTFLFTDLADFTPLVESSEPGTIVQLLNEYLDGVTQAVFAHEGTVVKILGDAVYAMFGAPAEQEDHAARAVRCAVDIDSFARGFAASQQRAGIPLGRTRIGVNTGSAIIGNFGGQVFFDYTAHGDAINVAARLEGANKHLGTHICVSATTVAEMADFRGRPIGELVLKGREAPLMTFEPLSEVAASSPETEDYRTAYAMLAEGDAAGARKAFAAYVSRYGDDPLALFHLQRLLAGRASIRVELVEK